MRYVILGGGMQGRVIAADLASRDKVEVVLGDTRTPHGSLPERVTWREVDALSRDAVASACKDADAVVVALPSAVGRRALEHVLQTGRPVVDVSFTPETLVDLHDDARRSGSCAVVDTGVAPGLSHVLSGAAHAQWGKLDSLVIHVGGMPLDPPPVFRHAVYFNPSDLIAEYYRPARLRHAGVDAAPMPMEAPVRPFVDDEMGTFEAFPSDGLRSLLASFPEVPSMVELTLRRPGHLDFMRALRETGFLDTHALIEGTEPPVAMAARVLGARFPAEAHPDFLLMVVEGRVGDRVARWRLLDRHADGVSAMSRTTGFTAAAVARLLAKGRFAEPGLHAPERLGADPLMVSAILGDLQARGVRVERTA